MKKDCMILLTALLVVGVYVWGCSSSDQATRDRSGETLQVERLACYERDHYAFVTPLEGQEPSLAALRDASFCSSRLLVGSETPLVAVHYKADGSHEVLSETVEWVLEAPPGSAEISEQGVLKVQACGDITVMVCADGFCSEPFPFTIIDDPEVVAIEIFPSVFFPEPFLDGIVTTDALCLHCPFWYELRILLGDTAQFFAHGLLECGLFIDLTEDVQWRSSDPEVALLDATGKLVASKEGGTTVTAEYGDLTSNEVRVEVLEEAVLTGLYVERQSLTGIIKVGGIEPFHAVAYYDPWMAQDKTSEVEWILSDPSKGHVSEQGLFTALAPGAITIQARYQGRLSDNQIEIEVWDETEMEFCDPANPNRSIWEDTYNRVILETNCASYAWPESVTIRYTIEEKIAPPWGILDPCLDLVILAEGSSEIVKTLRFEGCGDLPFDLATGAAEALEPIYQYLTSWDLTDDTGEPVPPGPYVVAGRFYIYYDPVIRLGVTVVE